MKLKLKQILNFLDENAVSYELYLNEFNEYNKVMFASVKSIIKNGIYFLNNADDLQNLSINESIVFTNEKVPTKNCLIVVSNPQVVHYKLCSIAKSSVKFGISSATKINENAIISEQVSIGENCVIGECTIEEGVIIKHNVVVEDNVIIRKNSFIDSNTVIGGDGLAWIWDEQGNRVMQPQLGGVIIEENCVLATDVTVVRGSLSENTLIGKGTVIAHGTKIGHGTQIKKNVHMANNVSVAGNSVIGERSFLGSACVISSNVCIGNNIIVGAGAVVNKTFIEEFVTIAGVPAKIIKRNNFESKPNGAPKTFVKKSNS